MDLIDHPKFPTSGTNNNITILLDLPASVTMPSPITMPSSKRRPLSPPSRAWLHSGVIQLLYDGVHEAAGLPRTDAGAVEVRKPMGNRVFGCDDCQLVCPWNRFAKATQETDFTPRHNLDQASLVELFRWDEATFLKRTEGSPVRRIGHERWLRNLAVGLGNATSSINVIEALKQRQTHPSALVREHVDWALAQHGINT